MVRTAVCAQVIFLSFPDGIKKSGAIFYDVLQLVPIRDYDCDYFKAFQTFTSSGDKPPSGNLNFFHVYCHSDRPFNISANIQILVISIYYDFILVIIVIYNNYPC